MHKNLLTCFSIILVLAAGAHDAAAETGPNPFRAGAATANITPKPGVLLDGTIMQIGPVKHIHDELFVRALALDDGITRLVIAICDCCFIEQDVYDKAKTIVNRRTGLPLDRMLFAATHSHCAIRAGHIGTGPLDDEYHEILAERMADAVVSAIGNLAPAKIGWGSVDKPEYPRCRRWLMKPGMTGPDPFGQNHDQVKMTGAHDKNVVKPVGPVDPALSVLSVQHADGRPLALLANYSIHYVAFKRGHVSADYFGYFARRMKTLLGRGGDSPAFVGIMSNGTSGDTRAVSGRGDPFERMRKVGHDLAEEARHLTKKIPHRGRVSLAMRQTEIDFDVRLPDKARLAWANATWAAAQPKRKAGKSLTRPEVYARETIHLSRFPPKKPIVLQAIRIGDLGIVAIPCEVFAETGLAVKRQSPLKQTFTISLANGLGGYLPPPEQHKLGGYTTWPARSSYLEIQAEPKIRQAVLRLLKEVAGKPKP